ncbi:MAG: hypothetical protein ACI9W6_001852 [Motiliproteus sp.]|jgi:hypothetical protein
MCGTIHWQPLRRVTRFKGGFFKAGFFKERCHCLAELLALLVFKVGGLSVSLTVEQLVVRARALDIIQLAEVITAVAEHYSYTPTGFRNGQGNNEVLNQAGQNEGSCKLLAFAQLHGLDRAQTLNLFGDYYHREVLEDAEGLSHANIRAFMRTGWDGVHFEAAPLSPL